MVAGLTDRLWSMEDVVALTRTPAPAKRDPYRKAQAPAA